MKTLALTLFAVALGFAQSNPPVAITELPKAKAKAAPTAESATAPTAAPALSHNKPPTGIAQFPKANVKAPPSAAPTAAPALSHNKPPTGITQLPKANAKAAPTAARTAKPTPTAKSASAQKAKAQPAPTMAIPAGAKLVEANLYRYTDSNGKTWNYRQTPFGVSRWEEASTPGAQPAPRSDAQSSETKSDPVAVTDLGDSYRFEKKTPFGHSSWTRKKSELTDEEKAYTSSVNSKATGNQ
jgi:hypothetical protein